MLASGGGLACALQRLRLARAARSRQRAAVEAMRALADEDVTLLGEELARLDATVAGQVLDEPAGADYQEALDAYERSARLVRTVRTADDLPAVVDVLSTGRYALARVQARVAGRPLPQHRTPCFFNPQHGPSVRQVLWHDRGRGTRQVPACAQDAARVDAQERPEVRRVSFGARGVPYWDVAAAGRPAARGGYVPPPRYIFDVYTATLGTIPADPSPG